MTVTASAPEPVSGGFVQVMVIMPERLTTEVADAPGLNRVFTEYHPGQDPGFFEHSAADCQGSALDGQVTVTVTVSVRPAAAVDDGAGTRR